MSIHLAQGPTHAFLNTLVATAEVGDVAVGDIVQVVGELNIDEGKVVQINDEKEIWVTWIDGSGNLNTSVVPPNDYVTTKYSQALGDCYERELMEGIPDGVAWGDGIVPSELSARLHASFDAIIASGAAEYHPRSNNVVLDLVHPSLYPYVKGKSELLSRPPAEENPRFDRWGRPFEGSDYQWLPTEVAARASGEAKFTSYVNNLHRPETVDELEELFSLALPLLESVYGYIQSQKFVSKGWEAEENLCESDLPEPGSPVKPQPPPEPISLLGRKLQVVPKLVEYQLDDEKTHSGVWHVEGMSHEHVIATAVYVLGRSDNFQGGELRFKRPYTLEEAGQLFWSVAQCRKQHTDEIVRTGLVPIGSLATPEGRLFVFPNCHAHKISDMRTSGGRATRRIVVFWLIDPEKPIISTAHVAPQQQRFSAEEAKEIQLALMEERRLHKQSLNVRAVELCEH